MVQKIYNLISYLPKRRNFGALYFFYTRVDFRVVPYLSARYSVRSADYTRLVLLAPLKRVWYVKCNSINTQIIFNLKPNLLHVIVFLD